MTTNHTTGHPKKTYSCSFCSKHQDQVQRLIAGPAGVYICDECLDLCLEILAAPTPHPDQNTSILPETTTPTAPAQTLHSCSFCHKPQDQVQSLLAGPGDVYICNECSNLYRERLEAAHATFTPYSILDPNPPPETTTPNTPAQTPYKCSFCEKPQDQVQSLLAGPGGVYICNECSGLYRERLEAGLPIFRPHSAPNTSPPPETTTPNPPSQKPHRCSFCGKPQDNVQRLIIGFRGISICNECVDICMEIIEDEAKKHKS